MPRSFQPSDFPTMRPKLSFPCALLLSLSSLAALSLAQTPADVTSEGTPDEPQAGLDAYGDTMPTGAAARMGTDRLRHDELVYWVGYVAGGDMLLSLGGDQRGRHWNPADGSPLGVVELGEQTPLMVSYAPAVEEIAVCGYDGNMEIWDAVGGERRERLEAVGYLPTLSPDGSVVAYVVDRNRVVLHDRRTGVVLREYEQPYDVERMLWSPAGTHLAVLSFNRMKLNRRGGTEEQPFAVIQFLQPASGEGPSELSPVELMEDPPLRLVFSPDGRMLFAAGYSGLVRAFQVPTGLELAQIQTSTEPEQAQRIVALAMSRDGSQLATGDEGGLLRVVDVASGALTREVRVGRMGLSHIDFSWDGTEIATTAGTSVRIWNTRSGAEQVGLQRHLGPISCAAFSPDGTLVVTGGYDGEAHIWNAADGTHVRSLVDAEGVCHLGWVFDLCFSPDGAWIVSAGQDGRARLWSTETGAPIGQVAGFERAVTGVSIAPDGSRLATIGGDRVLRMWSVEEDSSIAPVFEVPDLRGVVFGVRFDASGERVAAAGSDLRVFNAADGEQLALHDGLGSMVTAMDWGAGEVLGVGLASSQVRVFEPLQGETRFTLRDRRGRVRLLRFSEDGGLLATASEGQAEVQLWDAASGRRLGVVPGHSGGTLCAVFSPDGRQLFTGGMDGTGLVWNLSTDSR